jgi:hypothetical protein
VDSPSRISAGLRQWQAEWSLPRELAERQLAAVRSSSVAAAALRESSRIYRRNLNSHADGVTVVSILKLLDHLRFSTGLEPESAEVDDVFDLIPAVRIAARAALERPDEAAGAHATLGELCLVSGDQASTEDHELALRHYAEARVSAADRDALIERLRLFAALGFRPALVSEAIQTLDH